jgi:hypothetical protein
MVPPPSSLISASYTRAPVGTRSGDGELQPLLLQLTSAVHQHQSATNNRTESIPVLDASLLNHLTRFFYRRVCQPPYIGQAAITFRKMISINNVAVYCSHSHMVLYTSIDWLIGCNIDIT